MRFFRAVVQVCTAIGLLLLAASYLGAVHPVGDSLAVFRLWIAGGGLGFVVLLVILRSPRWAIGTALALAAAGGPIIGMYFGAATAADRVDVTVYSKNLGYVYGDHAAVAQDVEATSADIVLLQEYSLRRGTLLERLQASHPHQHLCEFSEWSGMAVLSRWPLSETYCSPSRSFAAAQVDHPDGAIWAVSTHMVWPYPQEQQAILAQALPFLDDIEGRAVVAGDFNMVPWGYSVRRLAEATGTARIGPLFNTIEVERVPLAIDHVYTNGDGTTERRPRLGSDHFGLVAHIGWP